MKSAENRAASCTHLFYFAVNKPKTKLAHYHQVPLSREQHVPVYMIQLSHLSTGPDMAQQMVQVQHLTSRKQNRKNPHMDEEHCLMGARQFNQSHQSMTNVTSIKKRPPSPVLGIRAHSD